jgi:hypothetical protein
VAQTDLLGPRALSSAERIIASCMTSLAVFGSGSRALSSINRAASS